MGWQDFAVWGIGIAAAAVVVRRIVRFFRQVTARRMLPGASTQCPLKKTLRT